MGMFETWPAGNGDSYLYLEEWPIARELLSELRRCAVYYRPGEGAAGWQFRIRKDRLPYIMAKLKRKKSNLELLI